MKISAFVLVVALMFSGVRSYSTSQSCSSVNGQMICTDNSSPDGTAASSGAISQAGPSGTYQGSTSAVGTPGGPYSSNQQTVNGGPGGGYGGSSFSSASSSSSSGGAIPVFGVGVPMFGGVATGAGAFAGPVAGMGFPFGGVAAGGFAAPGYIFGRR